MKSLTWTVDTVTVKNAHVNILQLRLEMEGLLIFRACLEKKSVTRLLLLNKLGNFVALVKCKSIRILKKTSLLVKIKTQYGALNLVAGRL